MEINVKLYAYLKNGRFGNKTIEIPEPATVADLLSYLEIKDHEVGSVFVNGKESTFTHVIHSGDSISLLPLIGGG